MEALRKAGPGMTPEAYLLTEIFEASFVLTRKQRQRWASEVTRRLMREKVVRLCDGPTERLRDEARTLFMELMVKHTRLT